VSSKLTTSVRGHDGLQLAVDRWPAAGAPPVILLHGGGQTRHAWGGTAEMLSADGYDVHALDLRGHGDSAWSAANDYRLSDFRDDVAAVLGGVSRPAVLVGASLGGIAALLAVGEGPAAHAAGLVLVDIAPSSAPDGAEKIQAFMRAAPEGFADLDEAVDAVAAYLPHRPRPKDPSGLMKNLRARDGRLHWHWDPGFMVVTAADRTSDDDRLDRAARQVGVPTLLVWGEHSEIVRPQDAEELVRLIPQSQVVQIAGARHMVAGDQNTEFGAAVFEFVRAVAPV
jgi:pimeloyl-ACP methyl ester carboxylesterase